MFPAYINLSTFFKKKHISDSQQTKTQISKLHANSKMTLDSLFKSGLKEKLNELPKKLKDNTGGGAAQAIFECMNRN